MSVVEAQVFGRHVVRIVGSTYCIRDVCQVLGVVSHTRKTMQVKQQHPVVFHQVSQARGSAFCSKRGIRYLLGATHPTPRIRALHACRWHCDEEDSFYQKLGRRYCVMPIELAQQAALEATSSDEDAAPVVPPRPGTIYMVELECITRQHEHVFKIGRTYKSDLDHFLRKRYQGPGRVHRVLGTWRTDHPRSEERRMLAAAKAEFDMLDGTEEFFTTSDMQVVEVWLASVEHPN